MFKEWEDEQARLAEAAMERVREFGRKSPEERFQWMVDRGLIDKDGNVTCCKFHDHERDL